MDTIRIFGEGPDLTALQMTLRGVVTFFIALALLRISGRRSFGIHTPLDNIISISLGSVLSRAIVGASPFIPVVVACFAVVLLHRLLAWLQVHHEKLRILEGRKILLFKDGNYIRKNLDRALLSEEDIVDGVRESESTEDMERIHKVYLQRNGKISVVKKE